MSNLCCGYVYITTTFTHNSSDLHLTLAVILGGSTETQLRILLSYVSWYHISHVPPTTAGNLRNGKAKALREDGGDPKTDLPSGFPKFSEYEESSIA